MYTVLVHAVCNLYQVAEETTVMNPQFIKALI